MIKVKIYGCGSIGNHLAYACRKKNWEVLMVDVDAEALKRTKNQIYPSRYGHWDNNICLSLLNDISKEYFDIVIIGTPPDTHIPLACDILKNEDPKILLIEKPLCSPSLKGVQEFLDLLKKRKNIFVGVGYNHSLTKSIELVKRLIEQRIIGHPISMHVFFQEHWGGIFKAHPWLQGPGDSYLGFWERGGGASGEHSHAIHLWQYLSKLLNMGKINELFAMLDYVVESGTTYDRICHLNVRTKKGLLGSITQDVVTNPHKKNLRIQGSFGFIEWETQSDCDIVTYGDQSQLFDKHIISKNRSDDFKGEIDYIERLLDLNLNKYKIQNSPISLKMGIETMNIIQMAHSSWKFKKMMFIDDLKFNEF